MRIPSDKAARERGKMARTLAGVLFFLAALGLVLVFLGVLASGELQGEPREEEEEEEERSCQGAFDLYFVLDK